jgi:hypothetical protein
MLDRSMNVTVNGLDGRYQEFIRWVRSSGAYFPKVSIGHCNLTGHRGLFAASTISPGELVIMVPSALGIYSSHAEEKLGPWASSLNDAEKLISLLIFEISQPRSFWRAYLRILPTLSDMDPPFLWPERTLNLLNGSAARHYTSYIAAGMHDAAANICAAASRAGRGALRSLACDRALVTWAYAAVRTRSLEASDGAGAMLLPLLDLANHAPLAPQMHLPFARGSGPAGLVCDGGVPAGGEVRARYGESSNANLLANYGFAVPDSPHDAVVVLARPPPPPPAAPGPPAITALRLSRGHRVVPGSARPGGTERRFNGRY